MESELASVPKRRAYFKAYDSNISPEKNAYKNIKRRCYNPNNPEYVNYGARGIKMCDEWLHNYQSFFDYIGEKPSPEYTIDRINNDGNYEPGNIRWATRSEQNRNRRHPHYVAKNNNVYCLFTKSGIPRWKSVIMINKKTYHNTFDNRDDAIAEINNIKLRYDV